MVVRERILAKTMFNIHFLPFSCSAKCCIYSSGGDGKGSVKSICQDVVLEQGLLLPLFVFFTLLSRKSLSKYYFPRVQLNFTFNCFD